MKGGKSNFQMKKFLRFFPKDKVFFLLALIFSVCLFIRFLYFPQNIYFGFDQARDAFESISIYRGDLKIVGPSTAGEGLFHGPLYWYLVGPLYILGGGNPVWPAGFLVIINALGVFLIFVLGRVLFNSAVGLISATVYAFSFEQTQYAMYFGNPAPAVLTILVFYLGLARFVFLKDWKGIPISLFGLGLSIQFEFFLIYLFLILFFTLLLFARKEFFSFAKRPFYMLVSFAALALPLATFILAEIKFNFRTLKTLLNMFAERKDFDVLSDSVLIYLQRLVLQIRDNIFSFHPGLQVLIFFLLIGVVVHRIVTKNKDYKTLLFLSIWILASSLLVLFGIPNLYYNNIGISSGVIILISYLLYILTRKNVVVGYVLVALLILSNLNLVTSQNKKGIISDIYVQEGMLLSREKQILDVIYQESEGKPIVVSALTMPLKINTTWAYLFNWYGKEKYNSIPYWAGDAADGYPGSLPVWRSQEEDYIAFSIVEPVRGIRQPFVDQFLETQEQYGRVVDEKVFGEDLWYAQFRVQKRE